MFQWQGRFINFISKLTTLNKKTIIFVIVLLILILIVFLYHIPNIKASYLVKAIKSEDYNRVEKMLSSGINPNITTTSNLSEFILNAVESTGERPLSVACKTGNLMIVKLLIEYGATSEPYDKCGWSPLNQTLFHYQANDKEIVKLLLNSGADVNEENAYGIPIFNAAAMLPQKYNSVNTSGRFYDGEYDEKVAYGITDIVLFLLEYGNYNIDVQSTYNGSTLLITATQSGNKVLMKNLIDMGCDINITDASGKTAYDYAIQSEDNSLITILTQREGSG